MAKVYSRTKGILPDTVSGFCPGCMHGTVHKLIGEAAEELGKLDKLVRVEGVGCCGLGQFYVAHDATIAAHGRACAVATGIKRSSPDSLVYTYQGDGDLASIGLAETMSAANRGENFTVIFVNNGIYGMTGGQMAPTTLIGMNSTTTPEGREPDLHGYPMHIVEILNQLTAPYYLERVSCNTPQNVIKARKAIKKAFQYQLEGKAMRGGTANCYVVISDDEIGAPVSNSVDDLVVMNGPSLHKFLPTLKKGGTLFINSSIVKDPIDRDDITVVSVPVTEMALEMGNPRVLNIIMLGAYIGYSNAVPEQVIYDGIHHKFEHKPKVIPLNDKAFKTGLDIGAEARQ